MSEVNKGREYSANEMVKEVLTTGKSTYLEEVVEEINSQLGTKFELETIGEGEQTCFRIVEKTQINNTKVITSFDRIDVLSQIIGNANDRVQDPMTKILTPMKLQTQGIEVSVTNIIIEILSSTAEGIEQDADFNKQCDEYYQKVVSELKA